MSRSTQYDPENVLLDTYEQGIEDSLKSNTYEIWTPEEFAQKILQGEIKNRNGTSLIDKKYNTHVSH